MFPMNACVSFLMSEKRKIITRGHMRLTDLPVTLSSLVSWEENIVKQLSSVDCAVASGFTISLEVWVTVGSGWLSWLEKWSNASMVTGSKFPSAIAVAIDGGISLVASIIIKENTCIFVCELTSRGLKLCNNDTNIGVAVSQGIRCPILQPFRIKWTEKLQLKLWAETMPDMQTCCSYLTWQKCYKQQFFLIHRLKVNTRFRDAKWMKDTVQGNQALHQETAKDHL